MPSEGLERVGSVMIERRDSQSGKLRQDAFKFVIRANHGVGDRCAIEISVPTFDLFVKTDNRDEEIFRGVFVHSLAKPISLWLGAELQDNEVVGVKKKTLVLFLGAIIGALRLPNFATESSDFFEVAIIFE